ncbi:RNA polymerase sigma factor [Oerskovia enterophila]|uniref:ECF RNA polymerase sigma factor SigI n=1 Tax=Oerskovia enterophila TaxID=43678 RepID=A0ABX2Y4K9_9CELL|nr:sigma-70 family RNA polymerase sigma factor [Oerskovia enterophila]OCI31253.1 putative ECF RNA polymerase sigma factor SigI [Oerskovia enterophila]
MTSDPAVEDLLRELAPQVLGTLARRSGDFAGAEDAVQEALLAAVTSWAAQGFPEHPRAWLQQVASRRLVDAQRSEIARRRRERALAASEVPGAEPSARDDSLALLFACCHPALTPPSAVALTLRAVGGLTTLEIARAFGVPEATMAQRISRAKQRVASSGEPLTVPGPEERPARLRSVLHVLYVVFTEGHTASAGPALQRVDLTDEAIRLTRRLHQEVPEDPEVSGLLALMLLTDARRRARTDAVGDVVPLAQQDRARWDATLLTEGLALLDRALARGDVGEYQLQAAIAAAHDRAHRAEDTDWPQIVGLYGLLERMTGSPVVTLNRAVAVAMVEGPVAGLVVLDGLGPVPGDPHRVDVVRAHLLERAGRPTAALEHYRRAAARATSLPEQRHLAAQVARLAATAG